MKTSLSFLIKLAVFIGLPASFLAQAAHNSTPLSQSHFYQWLRHTSYDGGRFFLPLLFVSVVMTVALLIAHHLREAQSIELQSRVFPSQQPENIQPLRKSRPGKAFPIKL